MKMSRIAEELERQGIEVTYENIAMYAVFVSGEKLIERLRLNEDCKECAWFKTYLDTIG